MTRNEFYNEKNPISMMLFDGQTSSNKILVCRMNAMAGFVLADLLRVIALDSTRSLIRICVVTNVIVRVVTRWNI